MLHYFPAYSSPVGDRDEVFGVDGFEIGKADFDTLLVAEGFNEADVESLGYGEIVAQINARNY